MLLTLKKISLKTRMALSVSLLFIVFGASMAYFTLSYLGEKYTELILNQQFTLVSSLALGIDNQINTAERALAGAATGITPAALRSRKASRLYIKNRPSLLALFDDGIFVLNKQGKVIAESSDLAHRQGAENAFQEFARQTLAKRKPHISSHYISTHLPGNPAVFISVPLFDDQGRVFAFLGGSIDLFGRNLINEMSHIKVGKSGYVVLCDSDRTIIVHPDQKRILQRVPEGANWLLDRAIAGFEGSGKTINSLGVPMFSSFKQLAANDWIIGANLPQKEGYASLYRATRYFLVATIAATSVIVIIVWLLMRRLTLPLMAISGHVRTLQNKSGREKLIRIDAGGEIGTLAEAFNDMIIAIETQQNTLQLRALELTAINRELESFSYSVSHDLRTPLTGISVAAQCLADDYAHSLDENGKFFIRNISSSCTKMEELIEALLLLSRLTRQELCMKRVDLSQLAEKVLLGLRMADPERQVQWSVAPGMDAWGDENLLEAVLENLIGNAWKYTGKTAEAFIQVGEMERNGERTFFVRDNGAGFDMNRAENLFLPFQRLHSGREFPGTGIGLATVQRIVERHEGKVWGKGAPGKGAVFYFSLPECEAEVTSPSRTSYATTIPAGSEYSVNRPPRT